MNQQSLSAFIWSIADLLRGDYKRSEFGRVILPFTVLRRLDCVLAPTKLDVREERDARKSGTIDPAPFLKRAAGHGFYNASDMDLERVLDDADNIAANLADYVDGFSAEVRDVFDRFEFHKQIEKLDAAGLLYMVAERFARIDLHPDKVTSAQMGDIFEELIRKFAEDSNETAGEHFTPRDVIQLMVDLIFAADDDVLTRPGIVRTIYDPTAGTGGMLSMADEWLREHNPHDPQLVMYGQELNPESWAICNADMLIKGQSPDRIAFGNTLSDDGHTGEAFDYMLANPPFGVEWKKVQREVTQEHKQRGHEGRFGPGLPRVSDGSLLFLLHMLSKMKPQVDGGTRFAIVLNGSPLFTGAAGGGESEIRRHLLEHDLVEAIVALPTDMFFNTGIATYVWIVSNRKPDERKNRVQLIDGGAFWSKMRKSLGSKRREIGDDDRAALVRLYMDAADTGADTDALRVLDGKGAELSRHFVPAGAGLPACVEVPAGASVKRAPVSLMLDNDTFGYRTITVERPQRDAEGKIVLGHRGKAKGKPVPDTSLRDTETVPLTEDIHDYFAREVAPHAPDAWIDEGKTKVGYEIPFNRHFYVFEAPRDLSEIDAELAQVTAKIQAMLTEMAA